MARKIRTPSRIDLQTRVRSVRWKRGACSVDADGPAGRVTYHAKAVIIALPLGVLQQPSDSASGVTFEPELPMRKALRECYAMGPVVRVVVRFREAFWEHMKGLKDISMIHNDAAAFPTWWTAAPLRTTLLTGWCGGAAADKLAADETGVRAAAVESLILLFGKSRAFLNEQIETIYLRDWRNDPHAFGAYSYARVGGAAASKQLMRDIDGTLFLAGEHTDLAQIGTVAGAIASGERAAKSLRASRSL